MVPITIISGFLGAGKTTLANYLLRYCVTQQEKTVYLVNEFGKTGLDAALTRHNGFESVELAGGCVCCTLQDDTLTALLQIAQGLKPDRILFEPSGVFVFESFRDILNDRDIRRTYSLGSVVTVVDSTHFNMARTRANDFLDKQIRCSSKLVISKLERFSGDKRQLLSQLRQINPAAEIYDKPWSQLDEATLADMLRTVPIPPASGSVDGHRDMTSVTLRNLGEFTNHDLRILRQNVVDGTLGDVCRVKGVIRLNGKRMLLNAVYQDWKLSSCPLEQQEDTLTFIGSTVDCTELSCAEATWLGAAAQHNACGH